jgi:hypothetical protein
LGIKHDVLATMPFTTIRHLKSFEFTTTVHTHKLVLGQVPVTASPFATKIKILALQVRHIMISVGMITPPTSKYERIWLGTHLFRAAEMIVLGVPGIESKIPTIPVPNPLPDPTEDIVRIDLAPNA